MSSDGRRRAQLSGPLHLWGNYLRVRGGLGAVESLRAKDRPLVVTRLLQPRLTFSHHLLWLGEKNKNKNNTSQWLWTSSYVWKISGHLRERWRIFRQTSAEYSTRTHINMAAVQLRPASTRLGPLICVPSEHVGKGSRFASWTSAPMIKAPPGYFGSSPRSGHRIFRTEKPRPRAGHPKAQALYLFINVNTFLLFIFPCSFIFTSSASCPLLVLRAQCP